MEREPKKQSERTPVEPPKRSALRHDLRSEEGEETELGEDIRAREPEEGLEPEVIGLEETQPVP